MNGKILAVKDLEQESINNQISRDYIQIMSLFHRESAIERNERRSAINVLKYIFRCIFKFKYK